jgi:UDP-N-acetylglucosamine 2-epimerase
MIVVVAGVRPQYVKAASMVEMLREAQLKHVLVDAAQHYDESLRGLVMRGLGLVPDFTFMHPSHDRHVRAGSIYSQLCELLLLLDGRAEERVVTLGFGDATTTVMAALASVAADTRFAHVEAGVRSRVDVSSGHESIENKYRRVISQISSLNLCLSAVNIENLERENAPGRNVVVGDLGIRHANPIPAQDALLARLYVLAHIHKTENTDHDSISAILEGLAISGLQTRFIVHPSVGRLISIGRLSLPSNVTPIEPMSHDGMLAAILSSRIVLTDSGSVQREAAMLGRRCIVRRDTPGWIELFSAGGHVRVDRNPLLIADALRLVWDSPDWGLSSRGFRVAGGVELAVSELRRLVGSP